MSDRVLFYVEEGLYRYGWLDDCVVVLKKVVLNFDCLFGYSLGFFDIFDFYIWFGYLILVIFILLGICGCDL